MNRQRLKWIALRATAGIAFSSVFLALLFAGEQWRTKQETGAVLSAFFSEVVLHDMDKWRAGRTVEIVIQRDPDCRNCLIGGDLSWFQKSLISRWRELSREWSTQPSRMTRASLFANNLFSTDITTDLNLPAGVRAFFVNPGDLGATPADFEAKFPNHLGYFVVSHIGLNLKKNEALLYIDHFCAGLCGGGECILMRKSNGVWSVVEERGTWFS